MLRLNDDCLCQIFGELTLKEQLIQCDVCDRFRSLVKNMLWRTKFREIPTTSAKLNAEMGRLSNVEYQTLFPLIVEYIEKFTIADLSGSAFTSYLGRFTNRPDFEFYLYLNFPKLQVLDCRDSRVLDAYMRLVAVNFPKLQVLRIQSNYVTGKFLKDMRNLRELYATDCSISADNLREIISNLNLTHLSITGNRTRVESGLLTDASKLQTLELSAESIDEKFVENVQNMRHLRKLSIVDLPAEGPISWTPFFESVGSNINALRIMNTSSYTELVHILAEHLPLLSNLEILHLKVLGEFPQITTFAKLTTLKELHLYNISFPGDFLRLIQNCCDLVHIYLSSFIGGFPDVWAWILAILGRLQKQQRSASTTRKLLTIHAICQYPDELSYRRLYEEITMNDSYERQNLLKFQLTKAEMNQSQLEIYDFVEFSFKSS